MLEHLVDFGRGQGNYSLVLIYLVEQPSFFQVNSQMLEHLVDTEEDGGVLAYFYRKNNLQDQTTVDSLERIGELSSKS